VVSFGAGESIDTIFIAPAYDATSAVQDEKGRNHNKYVLYDRAYERSNNLASDGTDPYGGRRTEVRVYPSGLLAQDFPNDLGIAV
jgi:hypothetical protein